MLGPLNCHDASYLMVQCYGDPKRYYHGVRHLLDVIELWRNLRDEFDDMLSVGYALAFHDCYFDPSRNNNEATSAGIAASLSRAYPKELNVKWAKQAIMATARHLEDFECDQDTQILLDIDLAVLGRSPEEYSYYAHGVRMEYLPVYSLAEYAEGRKKVLEALLNRSSIYRAVEPPGSTEKQAQENVEAELEGIC